MIIPLLYFSIFGLGLVAGSFLNVVIDRLPKRLSIVIKRSHCDHCKKKLGWYDLIPVLSFIYLRGRCRYCRKPISFYYPIVELTTGILFVFTVYLQTRIVNNELGIMDIVHLGYNLFIVSALIAIFFTDFKYGIIPDFVLIPSVIVSVLYLFIIHNSLFIIHLLSALSAFLFFLLIFLATRRRGMGFGDVKLSFLLGLFLGFPKIVVALYLAFLTGAIVSLILVLWGKKRFFGGTVPFGTFLTFTTLIMVFAGEFLLNGFFWVFPSLNFW